MLPRHSCEHCVRHHSREHVPASLMRSLHNLPFYATTGQGSSGWKAGPEGVASIGVSNLTLAALVQSYF